MAATDLDKTIGRNVSILRGNMSQDELARKMRERGYRWSQSTVWSIERGDRPLKFTEALDVMDCLGQKDMWSVRRLISSEPDVTAKWLVDELKDLCGQLQALWSKIEEKRGNLAVYAAGAREDGELSDPTLTMTIYALQNSDAEYMFKMHLRQQMIEEECQGAGENVPTANDITIEYYRDFYDQVSKENQQQAVNPINRSPLLVYLHDPEKLTALTIFERARSKEQEADDDRDD